MTHFKFRWIFPFFWDLLFVWRPLPKGEPTLICLLSQVSCWMKTEKDSEFKTGWQKNNERAHELERWDRGSKEGGKGRHCCQLFFSPSPNQQLLSGSDSAKLISRRECKSGEREETCGDFRNSSPKLYQTMLCCTLWSCSHTQWLSVGKQVCWSPRRCHGLSVI